MVGNRLGIAAEEISVDVERAGHLRRGIQCELSVAVLKIDVAGKNRLAVLDDIDVSRAAGASGEDVELNAVACLDHSTAGAEKDLIGTTAILKRNVAGGAVAVMVVGLDAKRIKARTRIDVDDCNAAAVSRDLLILRPLSRECGP